MEGAQQAKSLATRNRLLDAAAEIVRRDGVSKLTLDRVADEARTSKGGLLYHFGSKRELVATLLERTLAETDASLDELTTAHEDKPNGRFARAYLDYVCSGQHSDTNNAASIFAAASLEEGDLAPAQAQFASWQRRLIENDGLDETSALLARIVGDGLWLIDLFGLAPPTHEQRMLLRNLVETQLLPVATEHTSPPEESPLALQIALRVEKIDPPPVAHLCAAATRSVIELLADERSQPGGSWHREVTAWNGARIRKLTRRARGTAWERAQTAAGVTALDHGAEARAFVPGPMNEAPPEVAKLQIQSTPLPPMKPSTSIPKVETVTLMIATTPHFALSWGKLAAQCAHAGQRAWEHAEDSTVTAWAIADQPITIISASETLWETLLLMPKTTQIHDGGFTEIPPGTLTAISWFAPHT